MGPLCSSFSQAQRTKHSKLSAPHTHSSLCTIPLSLSRSLHCLSFYKQSILISANNKQDVQVALQVFAVHLYDMSL